MNSNMEEVGPLAGVQPTFSWVELLITQVADAVAARLSDPDRRSTPQSPWMDVPGVAAYLNSTSPAIRKAAQHGLLPGHQPGGPHSPWFFHRDEVDQYILASGPFATPSSRERN